MRTLPDKISQQLIAGRPICRDETGYLTDTIDFVFKDKFGNHTYSLNGCLRRYADSQLE